MANMNVPLPVDVERRHSYDRRDRLSLVPPPTQQKTKLPEKLKKTVIDDGTDGVQLVMILILGVAGAVMFHNPSAMHIAHGERWGTAFLCIAAVGLFGLGREDQTANCIFGAALAVAMTVIGIYLVMVHPAEIAWVFIGAIGTSGAWICARAWANMVFQKILNAKIMAAENGERYGA